MSDQDAGKAGLPQDPPSSASGKVDTQPASPAGAGPGKTTGGDERSQVIPRERFDKELAEKKKLAAELQAERARRAELEALVENRREPEEVPYDKRGSLTSEEWTEWSEQDPYAANRWLHERSIEEKSREARFVEAHEKSRNAVFKKYPQLNPDGKDFDEESELYKKYDEIARRPENAGVHLMGKGPEVVMRMAEEELGLMGVELEKAKEEGVKQENERQSVAKETITPSTEGKPAEKKSDLPELTKDQEAGARFLRIDPMKARDAKKSTIVRDKYVDEGIRWKT